MLTVNETIQVPGAVLEPGKYVMKLHDSLANRNIVQIFNADENKVLTTILAIPHYRMQPTGETELRFWETADRQDRTTCATRAYGQEFIYPKGNAVQIARQTHSSVPAIPGEEPTEAELEQAAVETVDEAGEAHTLDFEAYAAATIYAVGIYDSEERDRDPGFLRRLAAITGGEAFFPADIKELHGISVKIAADLRSRYSIGITPLDPRLDGTVRRLRVEAADADGRRLAVRTRTQYVAEPLRP